jgi:Tfp pilus assembly ATPase PilU
MTTTTNTNEKSTKRVITLLPPTLHSQVLSDAAFRMTNVSAVVREILARHYRTGSREEEPAL